MSTLPKGPNREAPLRERNAVLPAAVGIPEKENYAVLNGETAVDMPVSQKKHVLASVQAELTTGVEDTEVGPGKAGDAEVEQQVKVQEMQARALELCTLLASCSSDGECAMPRIAPGHQIDPMELLEAMLLQLRQQNDSLQHEVQLQAAAKGASEVALAGVSAELCLERRRVRLLDEGMAGLQDQLDAREAALKKERSEAALAKQELSAARQHLAASAAENLRLGRLLATHKAQDNGSRALAQGLQVVLTVLLSNLGSSQQALRKEARRRQTAARQLQALQGQCVALETLVAAMQTDAMQVCFGQHVLSGWYPAQRMRNQATE